MAEVRMSAGGDKFSIMTAMDRVRLLRGLMAVVLCLLIGGCGLISISVSNSSDGCPDPGKPVSCPR